MRKALGVMLAAIATISASLAVAPVVGAVEEAAKKQDPFADMKQIKLDATQGRIAILQASVSCITAATNHEQAKLCEEKERGDMEAFQQRIKGRWEALKK